MKIVSDRLQNLMENSDWSYSQLSKQTGIPSTTLHRYITGESKKIPASAIEILAVAFNSNIAYILGFTDDSRAAPAFEGSKNASVGLDGDILARLIDDPQKLEVALWIAELDEASLTKVASILALMLDKEIPSSAQE